MAELGGTGGEARFVKLPSFKNIPIPKFEVDMTTLDGTARATRMWATLISGKISLMQHDEKHADRADKVAKDKEELRSEIASLRAVIKQFRGVVDGMLAEGRSVSSMDEIYKFNDAITTLNDLTKHEAYLTPIVGEIKDIFADTLALFEQFQGILSAMEANVAAKTEGAK